MRVRVPASSANLGPGYDAFGLALELHDEFEARLAPTWRVDVSGEGAGSLAHDASNQVARAMARVFAEVGRPSTAAEIDCHNGIPIGRGLGSSSAAIVGGLLLADALLDARLGRDRLLQLATELEGHADNVAAALHGGFTVTSTEGGAVTCGHVDPAAGLAAIVALGEQELPTAEARRALPDSVPHGDAAANAGAAALVALGIALGDPALTRAGLRDSIHERYREQLIPDFAAVRSLFEAAGIGPAVLSGSGPTVVALVHGTDDTHALEHARSRADDLRPMLAAVGRGRVLALGIDRLGAVVA